MRILLKSLVLVTLLGFGLYGTTQAQEAWMIKTPAWELSKTQYETALKVKGSDPTTLNTSEQKRAVLQDLYIRESLLHQALAQSLDQDLSIQQQLEEMRKDLLARKALEYQLDKQAPDFTKRAQEVYQARLATVYTFPLRLKLQLIQINTPTADSQAKAKQQLTNLRQDLKDQKITFEQAIEQHSQATDKALTQDGQWYKADQLPTELFTAASQLTASEPLSEVISTDKALYLFNYLERRKPEVLEFDKVKDELIASLKTEYRLGQQQVLLNQLRQQFEQEAKLNLEP